MGCGGAALPTPGPSEYGDGSNRDGTAWSKSASGTSPLDSVWGSGKDDVWAVGHDGTVRHWEWPRLVHRRFGWPRPDRDRQRPQRRLAVGQWGRPPALGRRPAWADVPTEGFVSETTLVRRDSSVRRGIRCRPRDVGPGAALRLQRDLRHPRGQAADRLRRRVNIDDLEDGDGKICKHRVLRGPAGELVQHDRRRHRDGHAGTGQGSSHEDPRRAERPRRQLFRFGPA